MSLSTRLHLEGLTKRPRLELLIWTVCAVLLLLGVSVLVFIVARVVQSDPSFNTRHFPRNEDLATLGTVYQGIVGAAVALAGSLVAIRIAQLGLGTLQQQERRESADFLDNIIEKGIPPLIQVIIKLSEMQYAFRVYQGTLMTCIYTPGNALYIPSPFEVDDDTLTQPDSEQLRTYNALTPLSIKHTIYHPQTDLPQSYAAFTEAVRGLADALEEVCKNAFSYAIWRNSVPDFESKSYLRSLPQLYTAEQAYSVHRIMPLWEVSIQQDLIEFALILRRQVVVAQAPGTFTDVMKIKGALFDMLEYRRGQNQPDPSEDTLEFLELGYELFSEGIPDRETLHSYTDEVKAFYQLNHGAACLLDVVLCFPNIAELRAFLMRQYPHVFPQGASATEPYALEGVDLQAMLPGFFKNAKAEIDSSIAENKHDAHSNWLFGMMTSPADSGSPPL